jgi:hypothetical protein
MNFLPFLMRVPCLGGLRLTVYQGCILKEIKRMQNKYSAGFIKKAHASTLYNENTIQNSSNYMCFYCGYLPILKMEKELLWLDEMM